MGVRDVAETRGNVLLCSGTAGLLRFMRSEPVCWVIVVFGVDGRLDRGGRNGWITVDVLGWIICRSFKEVRSVDGFTEMGFGDGDV